MSPNLYWSGGVWKNGYAYRLIPCRHSFIYRFHNPAVEIFDGLYLQFQVSVMSGLVACLKMEEYEIVLCQGFYGSLCLAFIIGVGKSCCSVYDNVVQSGIVANAPYKVDSRNHVTALYLRIEVHDGFHGRPVASAPWPYAVGLAMALLV